MASLLHPVMRVYEASGVCLGCGVCRFVVWCGVRGRPRRFTSKLVQYIRRPPIFASHDSPLLLHI